MAAKDKRLEKRPPKSATHNLHVSYRFFETICRAINMLSVQQHELYSLRRLVMRILGNPGRPLYTLDNKTLEAICQPHRVSGGVRLTLRIDSAANDRLREFREHAEHSLGRPVSVGEALLACAHVIMAESKSPSR